MSLTFLFCQDYGIEQNFFSIPSHILKELEKYIIDFVWAGKKHKADKNILYANLEHGGLKITNIPNLLTKEFLTDRIV